MESNRHSANGIVDTCPNALSNNSLLLFITMINSVTAKKCNFLYPCNFPKDRSDDLKNGMVVDYIVAGAGSAGSVIANRLSEDKTVTVLVLEAGDYPPVDTQIPGLVLENVGNPKIDWTFYTQKSNSSCLSFKNGSCVWNRGKMLGGTSSLNDMFYMRGNPRDYDDWAKISNDSSWRWSNVLKYFKKSENIQWPPLQSCSLHGTEGLMQTTRFSMRSPLTQLMKDTYREMGYKYGINELPIGYFKTLMTIDRNGRRESTAKAFLSDDEEYKDGNYPNKRKNFVLSLNSLVTKVLIKNSIAKGMEVLVNGKKINVFARKEVILSCGSVKTPHVLMLSGIGPTKELKKFKIPQVVNLPVGQSLKDHFGIKGIIIQVDNSIIPRKSEDEQMMDIFEYFNSGSGKYSKPNTNNVILYNDPYRNCSRKATLQWKVLPLTANDSTISLCMEKMNMDASKFSDIAELNKNQSMFVFVPTLLTPKSRGVIKLASTNPLDKPLIYPNYLTDYRDIKVLLSGIKFVKSLLNTKAMQKANAKFFPYKVKNCAKIPVDSRQYWECIFRNTGTTMHDQVGTCKMAPRRDGGVVNSVLKVYGVESLRVADSSIMPKLPRGVDTDAPTIMIGEMCANFIKTGDKTS